MRPDDLASALEELRGAESVTSVAERLAALQHGTQLFQQVPRLLFEEALGALRDCGLKVAESKVRSIRSGDIEALRGVAGKAVAFARRLEGDVRPTIVSPATDLLCALAAFLTVDREPAPKSADAYDEWFKRQRAASYDLGVAATLFGVARSGAADMAGERIFHRRRRQAGARATADERRPRREFVMRQAQKDYAKAKASNQRLTPHGWAGQNRRKYKLTNSDGVTSPVSLRTLEGWLAKTKAESSQHSTELQKGDFK